MSKFRKALTLSLLAVGLGASPVLAEGDVDAGAKVFKKCKSCHQVGEGAENKVGPHLNDILGRVAGSEDGFRYSDPMVEAGAGGLVWDIESLDAYLKKPKKFIPGTRMSFNGLRKEKDRVNVIAYLASFTTAAPEEAAAPEAPEATAAETASEGDAAPEAAQGMDYAQSTGPMALGRVATPEEIAAWDIDIRPDGMGLPVGSGSVLMGEEVFAERCASCHGDFGEGIDRWPVLAGGQDTLREERPEKTVGSYWPYLSTVYDYVRRAMPFGDAQSLTNDEVYAITAYILYLNDLETDEEFTLSHENFRDITLPNEANFKPDDRMEEPHWGTGDPPCMTDCKPEPVEITMRARVLDVTPEGGEDDASGGQLE